MNYKKEILTDIIGAFKFWCRENMYVENKSAIELFKQRHIPDRMYDTKAGWERIEKLHNYGDNLKS